MSKPPVRPCPGDGQDWRTASLRALLLLTTIEGLLAVATIFGTRSMGRTAVVLGYSPARLVVGLGFLGLVIAFAAATLRAFLSLSWTNRIVKRIGETLGLNEVRLTLGLLALLYTFIVGAYVLFVFRGSYASGPVSLLQAGVNRFFGGMLWIVLIPVQTLAVVARWYSADLRRELFEDRRGHVRLVLFVVLTAATLQWITLALRADWLYEIQGWFWHYAPKRLRPSHVYLLLTGLLALAGASAILRRPTHHVRNLFFCAGLAFILQTGFGFAEGQGFESLRLKYVNTPLSDEMRLACESESGILESIRVYEATHGRNHWLRTKPPGLLSFYQALRSTVATIRPEVRIYSSSCFDMLSWISAFVLPAMASLVVVPMYVIERLLRADSGTMSSGLLYTCVPSVLLMPLIPDQFLFPLLFMVSVAALTRAMVGRSFLFGLLAGISFYLTIFVSFSMLPLVGLGIAWLVMEHLWGGAASRGGLTTAALGLGTGVVVAWVALLLTAGYNPILRMTTAMEYHRQLKQIVVTPTRILDYAVLNGVEFSVWSGLSLATLLVGGIFRSVTRFVGRRGGLKDSLALAYGTTFLGLMVGGQTQGEVGRLWLFLVPLACMLSVPVASKLLKDQSVGIRTVMALQLITAYLMFLNMDFR